ncbi:U3 small nucleolar RNA-associated protein 14 homolog A [Hylaeus volcanicus]|uniref:U3 small nucleolar RNA-associated protein 14 homolog A n=1 Tax=Hylaeus volcanicus TaxID=313075 RepID=UPI0023B7EEAB|nr:U3 small nucleolar RNA-associated protein 14 homolog A [Hylaeus volcanicus]
MSDTEFLDDTEQDVSESHSKLLDAVSQLDKGQRVKRAERSEPTLEVSEFHLVKSGISDQDAVLIKDLAKSLGKKGHHVEITRNLESARKKANVLQKPLEKPAAERIKRIVGFENTKKELKKWNAIITKNRTSESLRFPMNQSSMRLEPSKQFVKRFRIQSELEKELAALEPQKENIEQKADEFSLTLEEIAMKRKEAARIRAQQSYREAKSRRQGKIKSKKFHRVQKKERIKLQLKEFEELQKTDPEAALEKLEQLDKSRAEERMSLRHKSTGKWAKSKQIRAKYDKDTRQELAQQLSVSRELTQKLRKPDDNEMDNEDESPMQPILDDKENPWVNNSKTETEIDEFVKSYRKYWDKQNSKLKSQEPNVNKNDEDKTETKKAKLSAKNVNNLTTFEDKAATEIKFSETRSNENDVKPEKSNDENIIQNLHNVITKRKISDNNTKLNKKVKLQKKDLRNITATSTWNVEPVENDNVQEAFHSSTLNILSHEKMDNMFDVMEEKIQNKVKSKLERITQDYSKKLKKHEIKKSFEFEQDDFDGLEIQAKNRKPIIDSSLHESVNEHNLESDIGLENAKNMEYRNTLSVNKPNRSTAEIDPDKYINVKPKQLNTDFPTDVVRGDDVLDDSENEDEKHNVISEAFADDDVVEQFQKEKQEEVEKFQPKDIDLSLPGWGYWGGKNIKVSKRKKERFILKFPKDLPRKDENKGEVIIFEDGNTRLKEHQVTELPYPFTSVKDYEASLRMPIGRNFVPENAHRKLIEPSVKTSMGKIIEPMSEDVLVNQERKKQQSIIKKKKNKIIKNRKTKINNK